MQASGRGGEEGQPGKGGEARSGRSGAAVAARAAAGRHGWWCACVRGYDVAGAAEDAVALKCVLPVVYCLAVLCSVPYVRNINIEYLNSPRITLLRLVFHICAPWLRVLEHTRVSVRTKTCSGGLGISGDTPP